MSKCITEEVYDMIQRGYDLEKIAEYVGLDIEQVKFIKNQMERRGCIND